MVGKLAPLTPEMRAEQARQRLYGGFAALVVVFTTGRVYAPLFIVLTISLIAAVAAGAIAGAIYEWLWQVRINAYIWESMNRTTAVYEDNNWGPVWRQLARRFLNRY